MFKNVRKNNLFLICFQMFYDGKRISADLGVGEKREKINSFVARAVPFERLIGPFRDDLAAMVINHAGDRWLLRRSDHARRALHLLLFLFIGVDGAARRICRRRSSLSHSQNLYATC
jgi:hypothetical protein